MGKIKDLAVEQKNDLVEIAESAEHLKVLMEAYVDNYGGLSLDNSFVAQSEETPRRSFDIDTGIVSFVEMMIFSQLVELLLKRLFPKSDHRSNLNSSLATDTTEQLQKLPPGYRHGKELISEQLQKLPPGYRHGKELISEHHEPEGRILR